MDFQGIREALRRVPFAPFSMRLADGRSLGVTLPQSVAAGTRRVMVAAPDDSWSVIEPLLVASLDCNRKGSGSSGVQGALPAAAGPRRKAMTEIHIEQGDLTACAVDAIVNAANNDLKLGGGLAGAIRRKGGPQIQAECDRHGPVRVGGAAITGAGRLPARHVIHQASMRLGGRTTAQSLRDSTRAVLKLAEDNDVRTLAFPATGTGIAGFDTRQCAEIMLQEVRDHIAGGTKLTDVYFVLFDAASWRIFQEVYNST